MSVFNAPCRWQADSTNAENEIREIFFQHWERLKDQFVALAVEIQDWQKRLVESINNHVAQQMRILEEDYQRQMHKLDQQREESLDTTRACCTANNVDLYGELRGECQLLQFQAAQLENTISSLEAPRVIPVSEQMERKKKENLDTIKSESGKSEEKLLIEQTNHVQQSHGENEDLYNEPKQSASNEKV